MRHPLRATLALLSLLTVAGCASPTPPGAPTSTVARATTADADPVRAQLSALGLADKPVEEVVDALDRSTEDRRDTLRTSVRQREVVFTAGGRDVSVPMPADKTYVSVAPYAARTHECFNHNLATCQGEMVGKEFTVTVVDTAGKEVVRTTQRTYANGFLGFWVPRDVKGTITVEGEGRRATGPFGSGPDDPTCVTTLQLS